MRSVGSSMPPARATRKRTVSSGTAAVLLALALPAAAAAPRATPAPCGLPPRIQLEWDPPEPDVVALDVEVGTVPGGTDFVRPAAGTSALVEGLSPGRTYWLRLRETRSGGGVTVGDEVSADTPTCSDAHLSARIVLVADSCPTGGAGRDGRVDPGEPVRLRVRVENSGTAPAPDVRLRPASRSPHLTARTVALVLGEIAPGGAAEGDVEVDASATAACGQPLELLLRTDSAGTAWADLLDLPRSAACVPCVVPGCSAIADASRTAPRETCAGGSVTLDAGASSVSGCAGVATYEWLELGAPVATTQALSRTPGGTTDYELVVRCSTDLACEARTSVTVTVRPPPLVRVVEDPPPPHCAPDVVTLTASCGDPAATYAWSDGALGAVRTVSGSTVLRVTATDSFGCRGSRDLRVRVNEPPRADAGPDVAGACGSVIVGTPGDPLLDYAWEPAAGLSDPRSPRPVVAPPGGRYVLTVTDPTNGCASTDEVEVAVAGAPPAPQDLRVARNGAALALAWSPPADPSSSARAYAAPTPRMWLPGWAASAAVAGEGRAGCEVPVRPEPLTCYLVVATCASGGEGAP